MYCLCCINDCIIASVDNIEFRAPRGFPGITKFSLKNDDRGAIEDSEINIVPRGLLGSILDVIQPRVSHFRGKSHSRQPRAP